MVNRDAPAKRPAAKRPAASDASSKAPRLEGPVLEEVQERCFASAIDSVVKVFSAFSEPNYAVPWVYKTQDAGSGTAFPIACRDQGRRWLLTNAHVVRYAAVVQVRKRGDHQKFIAEVLCIGLECDLAILTVNDANFWRGLPLVELNVELPQLQDEVTVVGFPIGGDNTCVTVGVVSRIDMQPYNTWWSNTLLTIQIDAAINPGNSGGPCFGANGKGKPHCIGVAFQGSGHDEAENIGYIIPAEVVQRFLDDYETNGCYTGFAGCGFAVQRLENMDMRKALGLRRGQTGMLVRRAHVQPLVRHDPPAPPPYYIVGGLVFVPLSEPFLLHQYGSKFDKDAPIQMRWYWSEGVCKFDGHEIIVLSQVLASPLTVGFTDFYDAVLLRFNGTEPENLGHLIQMVRQCKASYLEFEIEGHCRIVLPRRKTFDQTPAILRDNMIPRDRSIQYT